MRKCTTINAISVLLFSTEMVHYEVNIMCSITLQHVNASKAFNHAVKHHYQTQTYEIFLNLQ